MTKEAIYIGNKDTFAIRYMPDYSFISPIAEKHNVHSTFCHLVLDGYLIGLIDEPCNLSSWKYAFEHYAYMISYQPERISSPIFMNKTDDELWELLEYIYWKTRVLPVKKYSHVTMHLKQEDIPELEKICWACVLSIGETTDRFMTYVISMDEDIKFIWKKYRARKLRSITLKRTIVVETMEACIRQIETDYPDLAYYWK